METTGTFDSDEHGRSNTQKRERYIDISIKIFEYWPFYERGYEVGYLAGQKAATGNPASPETSDSGDGERGESGQEARDTLRKALISLLETAYHEEHIIPFPGYIERLDAILQEHLE